jgi:radical SAM protein with 4Fe4S-binding SPASM domain
MDCSQGENWLSNKDYLIQFNRKVTEKRIPLSGSLALTHRCNLKCIHCYVVEGKQPQYDFSAELGKEAWFKIIDELVEAGCLYLTVTGGEPLLSDHFKEVYTYTKTKGMLVTLFTNGTLITDELIQLFREFPPKTVEISLYGANADTYEKITGVKGSYERCYKGIQNLKKNGVRFKLKTVLMKQNRQELDQMREFADTFDSKFRFDGAIFPRFDNDKVPLSYRVPAKFAFEKEFEDPRRREIWNDFYKRASKSIMTDSLFKCGAGLSTFHIDSYGNLYPCIMATSLKYNLVSGSFNEGWMQVIKKIRDLKIDKSQKCRTCKKISLCGYCPPFFELESGRKDGYSQFLCDLGHLRYEAIQNIDGGRN